jgi:mycoredoxin
MGLGDLVLGRPTSTSHAAASAGHDQGVTVYWRPGCPFCVKLRWAIRRHRADVTWVNIWEDPAAAAYVATTDEGGHETVPTVVIDGVAHTNPDPGLVRAHLRR